MSPFKDPYVFEFVDIPKNQHVLETDLESVLIDSLEEFLLELGRGFSFVKPSGACRMTVGTGGSTSSSTTIT